MKYKYVLCLFFKDVYLSTFKDISEEKLLSELYGLGNKVILDGMKQGQTIKMQIQVYEYFLNQMVDRKKNKQGIHKNNHKLICTSIGALLKLKAYEESDLICCLKRKFK